MANTVEQVSQVLRRIYNKGFEKRGEYRIQRSDLRSPPLFDMARLEGGTIERLRACLREEGYLLTSLDTDDDSRADIWIVQRIGNLQQKRLADDEIITRVTEPEDE